MGGGGGGGGVVNQDKHLHCTVGRYSDELDIYSLLRYCVYVGGGGGGGGGISQNIHEHQCVLKSLQHYTCSSHRGKIWVSPKLIFLTLV